MATYYVSSSGGTGAGTVGDPWSLAHLLDTGSSGFATGDVAIFKADGTYSLSATSDWGVVGAVNTSTVFIGANSSGVIDGTRPTIQASASITGGLVTTAGATNCTFCLFNFDANGNADHAVLADGAADIFLSCIMQNATAEGVDAGTTTRIFYSRITGNAGRGVLSGTPILYRCIIDNNTSAGVQGSNTQALCIQCVAEDNGNDGYTFVSAIDCLSIGNTSIGFDDCAPTINCLTAGNSNGWDTSTTLWCAYGSGAQANTSADSGTMVNIIAQLDAGTALFANGASTPPDYGIPSSSSLDGAGVYFARSLFGSETRSGIGIGDFEPAAASGGGGSPLQSPFIRV